MVENRGNMGKIEGNHGNMRENMVDQWWIHEENMRIAVKLYGKSRQKPRTCGERGENFAKKHGERWGKDLGKYGEIRGNTAKHMGMYLEK